VIGQVFEDWLGVQLDELLPAEDVHFVDVASVRPVAVVHGAEREAGTEKKTKRNHGDNVSLLPFGDAFETNASKGGGRLHSPVAAGGLW